MADFIDINGSFEDGWFHATEDHVASGWHYMRAAECSEVGNQSFKLPLGWIARWADDSVPNVHGDGQPWNQFVAPEFDLKHRDQLPDHEKDLFILDGNWAFKPFKDHAWMAELFRLVELDAGLYRFTARVYPDLVASYQDGKKVWATDRPGFLYFVMAVADSTRSEILATPGQWMTESIQFRADGWTTIGLGFICPWSLKNSGWFCDNWTLERIDEEPPQPKYRREAFLIPRTATAEQELAIFEAAQASKRTIAWSADDACGYNSHVESQEITVYDVDGWGGVTAFESWLQKRFPHRPPTELVFCDLPGVEPSPPPPPELAEVVTLHIQDRVDETVDFVRDVKPAWVKLFTAEQAASFKAASPDTKVLLRYFMPAYDEFIFDADPIGAANRYLDRFWDTLVANAAYIDAIEGSNERVESRNDELNIATMDFEEALAEVLAERDIGIVLASPNIPVGNLEPSEVGVMVDLVCALIDTGGFVSYHPYWPVTPTREWRDEPQWFEERWMLWDEELRIKYGLEPHYLGTEAGACAALTDGSGKFAGFLASEGWRSDRCTAGTFEQKRDRFLDQIMWRRERIAAWNATHGNRFEMLALFTVNQKWMGWDQYRLNEILGDLADRLLIQ